jgi:hypothetical protein
MDAGWMDGECGRGKALHHVREDGDVLPQLKRRGASIAH